MYKLEGKDIVISGFENGIANDPYSGIADIRCANISSTPKEVAVNFSTQAVSTTVVTGSVLSADAGTDYLTVSSTASLENKMAISFAGGSLPVGISATSTYWIGNLNGAGNGTFKIYDDYPNISNVVNITGTGTGTFSTYTVQQPKHFATNTGNISSLGSYFMVDSIGQVWSNLALTDSNSYWTYTGNRVPTSTYTNGNGLVYYQSSTGVGYLFVFHNSSIDYTPTATGTWSWVYQWNPNDGTALGYSATPTQRLKTGISTNYSHEAMVLPDGRLYYCDANYIGRFYETDPAVPFVPGTLSTYTYTQTPVIPTTDVCQCIAPSGTNLLIGGMRNIIYTWDKVSPSNNGSPLIIGENNIVKLVTSNTNTYAFAGNRGRIYVTNGSNANFYKKIPDNISGVVEPYFAWGGACVQKNRLYFGFSAGTNASQSTVNLIPLYKGLWSVDLDTDALVCTNQINNNVYANALIATTATTPTTNPLGAGLFIGWTDNPTSTSAVLNQIDTTSSTPYSNNQTQIITDIIPVGTYLNPKTLTQIEWKTSVPLGSNGAAETIVISYTTSMKRGDSQQFVYIGSTTTTGTSQVGSTTGTTVGGANVSDYYQANFQKVQWIQIKAVLNSTASATTATFNRLTEIRLRDYQK